LADEGPVTAKKKVPARPPWASYWLLRKHPFDHAKWLRRWTDLKEELERRFPR
jgi:hypothetical protein